MVSLNASGARLHPKDPKLSDSASEWLNQGGVEFADNPTPPPALDVDLWSPLFLKGLRST